ncbi:7270_t:CDS:2, partial [Entrophospora sp. SA101]
QLIINTIHNYGESSNVPNDVILKENLDKLFNKYIDESDNISETYEYEVEEGITKPAIRRLTRRGGVRRISELVYEETRSVLKMFLENDTVTYTEYARCKTVTSLDVVYALKRQGVTLYGFNR